MAPVNKKAKAESATLDDPTFLSVMLKALRRDKNWTLAELQDCLLWIKVVFAIITGIICGYQTEGIVGLVTGVSVVGCLTTVFVQVYLQIDEEAHGGIGSLLLDSSYVAFAAFLVSWTITHSMLFGEDLEEFLQQARVKAVSVPPTQVPL